MLKEYRPAILFLATYIALYLALNTIYAIVIDRYAPGPDPVTIIVTREATAILTLFHDNVNYFVSSTVANVPITKDGNVVVEVYEGCNSINVLIVYISFILAFRGPRGRFFAYLLIGGTTIYIVNLFRVIALYAVAFHFPNSLYFFHKFFFTGIIYGLVFVMWYFWIQASKNK
jgi:exosortase family protein XrtF